MKTCIAICLGFFGCALLFGQGTPWGGGVPVDYNLEGNSSTERLFSYPSHRFQQPYQANHFVSPSQAGGVLLQSISFRLDAVNGATFSRVLTNMQINLSVTPRPTDSLSPVFADNIGINASTVFSGSPSVFAAYSPGLSPQSFEIHFLLDQPYLYRPSDGNLLMDFQTREGFVFAQLDAWLRNSDGVGSVYGNLDSPAGQASTLGLVTFFSGTLVPEPSTCVLLVLGAITFCFFGWRKRT